MIAALPDRLAGEQVPHFVRIQRLIVQQALGKDMHSFADRITSPSVL